MCNVAVNVKVLLPARIPKDTQSSRNECWSSGSRVVGGLKCKHQHFVYTFQIPKKHSQRSKKMLQNIPEKKTTRGNFSVSICIIAIFTKGRDDGMKDAGRKRPPRQIIGASECATASLWALVVPSSINKLNSFACASFLRVLAMGEMGNLLKRGCRATWAILPQVCSPFVSTVCVDTFHNYLPCTIIHVAMFPKNPFESIKYWEKRFAVFLFKQPQNAIKRCTIRTESIRSNHQNEVHSSHRSSRHRIDHSGKNWQTRSRHDFRIYLITVEWCRRNFLAIHQTVPPWLARNGCGSIGLDPGNQFEQFISSCTTEYQSKHWSIE